MALAAAAALFAVACSSDSDGVATLDEPAATVEVNTAGAADATLDDEGKVMAFAQCMRDKGFEYKDPTVNSEGNVQPPAILEGVTYTRAQLAEPYTACSKHIEGLTFGRERPDLTAAVDNAVELSICLRGKGVDIDDPTIETFEQWRLDLRTTLDWSDPKVQEAYNICNEPDETEDSSAR